MKPLVHIEIVKTNNGYSVVNKLTKDSVDLFPKTDEGQKRLVQFLCDNLLNKE